MKVEKLAESGKEKKRDTISISFRFECQASSTLAALLTFVRSAAKETHPVVPNQWTERIILPLESFWLPDVLHSAHKEDQELRSATFGCITQLERHIVALQRVFQVTEVDALSPSNSLVDHSSRRGKLTSITYRLQPREHSKNALLLAWVKDPDTSVMHSMSERVILAFEAFWLPFALWNARRSEDELKEAALGSIYQLRRRASELHDNYLLQPSQEEEKRVEEEEKRVEEEESFEHPLEEESFQDLYEEDQYDDDGGAAAAIAGWG